MKKLFTLSTLCILFLGFTSNAQETAKKAPASPPASTKETLTNGTIVSIDYAQPAVKGRTIGKEIAPFGKVWRTGANAATIFEVSRDVKINGKALPAGKYSMYTIPGEAEWVLIFNKTWKQPGTSYTEADDALRVMVKPGKTKEFTERMTFAVAKNGKTSLMWGDTQVNFTVK